VERPESRTDTVEKRHKRYESYRGSSLASILVSAIGRAKKPIPAGSAVFVYPQAPFIEVVGPTLICDRLERADFNTIMQRDSYRPNFAGIGVLVLEDVG
jgi:hypothetical protein